MRNRKIEKIEIIEKIEKYNPREITNEINIIFNNLFAKALQKSIPQVNNFFENIIPPVLTQEQKMMV